jgi:hypothetical protein
MCVIRSSEPATGECDGVYMGRTHIYRTPFFIDRSKLINPHISVLGMTGSGKTYFLKCFLVRSRSMHDSSILIIDWNNEYNDVINLLDGKHVELGGADRINVFTLFGSDSSAIKRALALISELVALELKELSLLSKTIDGLISENEAVNLNAVLTRLNSGGKDPEGLSMKIAQLRGNCMFSDRTTFDISSLLEGVTVVNLLVVQSEAQKKFVTGAIIELVNETMHRMDINSKANHIVVLDEAWKLIGESRRLGHLFREGRKYGVSVVIATQLASDINNEILANSGCVMVFRLQSGTDYGVLKTSGVLDDASATRLQGLQQGSCFVRIAEKDTSGSVMGFFIDKVDGFQISTYCINGENMRIIVQNERFLKATQGISARNDVKAKIMEYVDANSKNVDAIGLVRILARNGVERHEVVTYLRSLGLPDLQILFAYENSKDVIAMR